MILRDVYEVTSTVGNKVKTYETPSDFVVGITSGCFDIVHPIHVNYFHRCRRECDLLIVLVDSNKLVTLNKGKAPVQNEMDRAFMVDNIKSVDIVMVMNNLEELRNVARYPFYNSVIFKNSNKIYGKGVMQVNNVETIIVPDVNVFCCTTEIIDHIKNNK